MDEKPLRAFPPKDLPGVRGWNCVKSLFGPLPLLWPLLLPPHQATLGSWPYRQVVSTSGPTLEKRRSRRRRLLPHFLCCCGRGRGLPGPWLPWPCSCKGSCLPVGQTEGLTLPRWQTIPPTRRCGLCIPRLAPERRGKSRSRRCTSSPHQTRLRWALAGAPSCHATSLYTREALRLAVTGSQSPARWKQRLPG